MGTIKDRNETNRSRNIKNRWQEYTEDLYKEGLYKKGLHDPHNCNGIITHVYQTS